MLVELPPDLSAGAEVASAVPGELLIHFRDQATNQDIQGLYQAHGLTELERLYNGSDVAGTRRVSVPEVAVDAVRQALQNNPMIDYAEPNFVASPFFIPNDSFYGYQWNFDNPTYGGINLESAWETATGANTIVAVLDTGVAYEDYQDATGAYYLAPDLASTHFVPGYDFINNDAHANDDHSHGTHVAGTIAQSTNNARGIAGVAFDASVMPVKVLGRDGLGSYSAIANGVRWAADQGAHVINMSLGGASGSQTLEDALAYAYGKGVTIIAAAGNDGKDAVSYPAAYDDYVIAVSATRFDESLASYSNYGSSIDLAAPGGDTSVDQNGDGYVDGILQNTFNPSSQDTSDFGYYFFQGTSMAAPHVAGVAALIVSQGVTDPAEVRHILQSTATDRGATGVDNYYGHGIVDAAAAVAAAAAIGNTNTAPVASDDSASTTEDTSVVISVLENDSDPDGDPLSIVGFTSPGNGTVTDNGNDTLTYSPNLGYVGSDSFSYTISDPSGATDTAVVSVMVEAATDSDSDSNLDSDADPDAVRVVDLDGSVTTDRNRWQATVNIALADGNGSGAAAVTITGQWSNGKAFSGTTDAEGRLTATSGWLHKKSASISFTVENVNHPDYDPALNSDPDGDSDGTSIIVYKDGTTAAAGFRFVNEQDKETRSSLPLHALDAIAKIETNDVGGGHRQSLTLDYEAISSQFGANAQLMIRFGDDMDLRAGNGWELGPPQLQTDEIVHTLRQNGVEVRIGNGRSWTNPLNPVDVNYNNRVEPLDALQILNLINRGKGGDLSGTDYTKETLLQYYDTTGDGSVGPIDVLQVINALNRSEPAVDSFTTDQSLYPPTVSSRVADSSRTAEESHDEALLALVDEQEVGSPVARTNETRWHTANPAAASGVKAKRVGSTATEDADEPANGRALGSLLDRTQQGTFPTA